MQQGFTVEFAATASTWLHPTSGGPPPCLLSGTTSGDAVRGKLAEDRYGSILVDTRELAAELLYYLRDDPTPLYVWSSGPIPMHHYEMTRPFKPLATVVIGGLISATLLTLLVLPALYARFGRGPSVGREETGHSPSPETVDELREAAE